MKLPKLAGLLKYGNGRRTAYVVAMFWLRSGSSSPDLELSELHLQAQIWCGAAILYCNAAAVCWKHLRHRPCNFWIAVA